MADPSYGGAYGVGGYTIPAPPPEERTFTIPAETRTLPVDAENRTITVEAP